MFDIIPPFILYKILDIIPQLFFTIFVSGIILLFTLSLTFSHRSENYYFNLILIYYLSFIVFFVTIEKIIEIEINDIVPKHNYIHDNKFHILPILFIVMIIVDRLVTKYDIYCQNVILLISLLIITGIDWQIKKLINNYN